MSDDKHWKVRKQLAEFINTLLTPLLEHHEIFSSNNSEKQRKTDSTTSTQARNIVKGNHTKPQPVEKLPPLKKEINIPTYIHVTF